MSCRCRGGGFYWRPRLPGMRQYSPTFQLTEGPAKLLKCVNLIYTRFIYGELHSECYKFHKVVSPDTWNEINNKPLPEKKNRVLKCVNVRLHGKTFLAQVWPTTIIWPYANTTVSVKHMLFALCSLSDNWQLLVKHPIRHLTSSPKHLSSRPNHLSSIYKTSGRQAQSIWQTSVRRLIS